MRFCAEQRSAAKLEDRQGSVRARRRKDPSLFRAFNELALEDRGAVELAGSGRESQHPVRLREGDRACKQRRLAKSRPVEDRRSPPLPSYAADSYPFINATSGSRSSSERAPPPLADRICSMRT